MALVVVVSKFTEGAWIPAVIIPIIVLGLQGDRQALRPGRTRPSTCPRPTGPARHTHYVVVLVGSVNKGALNAIGYARSLAPDRLIAVTVVGDAEEQEKVIAGVGGLQPAHRAPHHLVALP